jgi:hypothetical protein
LIDDLDQLEEKLKTDKDVKDKLVTYLSVIGGKSYVSTVQRIMAAVVGPNLAKKFNWYGKKGKRSFKALELASIVFTALQRSNPGHSKRVSAHDLATCAGKWLTGARHRNGGWKRQHAPTEQEYQ